MADLLEGGTVLDLGSGAGADVLISARPRERRGGGIEDAEMLSAMRLLFERQKLVIEPSGSAALSGRVDVRVLRVG